MTYISPSVGINASAGIGNDLAYVNYASSGWLSNMILFGIWIIVLIGYYKAKDDFAGAMAVAGWGTFVVGLLFWLGGFITGWTFSVVVAMALVGVIIILVDNSNG